MYFLPFFSTVLLLFTVVIILLSLVCSITIAPATGVLQESNVTQIFVLSVNLTFIFIIIIIIIIIIVVVVVVVIIIIYHIHRLKTLTQVWA